MSMIQKTPSEMIIMRNGAQRSQFHAYQINTKK